MTSVTRRDYRDRVITQLADSEYWLARKLVARRELISVMLEQLHRQHHEQERMHESYRRLLSEYRSLREQVLRSSEVTT